MDRRIDLTLNRDFSRRRSVYSDRPRSIFNRKNPTQLLVPSNVLANTTLNGTTIITNNSTWYSSWSSDSTTNIAVPNNVYQYGDVCWRCGKDISRVPWLKEKNICGKCLEEQNKIYRRRIPWK